MCPTAEFRIKIRTQIYSRLILQKVLYDHCNGPELCKRNQQKKIIDQNYLSIKGGFAPLGEYKSS
jgi:Pyruvate/2-oxoacid:ferredoxin oxidoreductase delta subunit